VVPRTLLKLKKPRGLEPFNFQLKMGHRLHRQQLQRLTAARSVTDRVFTSEEHAQNHCQIGNIGLALQVMREWIETKAIGEVS
jgi:hypothetical protein